MKTYTKDFKAFGINENSMFHGTEMVDEEMDELMAMLHRCVLQARRVNDMMYELEEPGDIMSDSRDAAEKLKQIWSALTTGDPRDASTLGEIFK